MNSNLEKVMKMCEEDPSLIFNFIKDMRFEIVQKVLDKKIVDINTVDNIGNDVVTRLLKAKQYKMVLKYMKKTEWDVNHQNIEGNTFAHYLVSMNYVNVLEIIKELRKNKKFMPNIKNNKQETILDKSINENYMYTTLKILEDKRFNSIDIVSFKRIFDTYIKNPSYGKYSKLDNLTSIVKCLEKKDELLPKVENLIEEIKKNMDLIKNELLKNKSQKLEVLINEYV